MAHCRLVLGTALVAQIFGGRVLKISPAGKLLHIFEIAAGNGPTNVTFDEGEKPRRAVCRSTASRVRRDLRSKPLFVTVVKDLSDPQCKGSIVKIPNVR